MIRKKKRNNPHTNDQYLDELVYAIIRGSPKFLSSALNYYKIGDKCKDCDEYYEDCTCEGDREGGRCFICGQNRCICDFDIWDEDDMINMIKVQKTAWDIANKTLDKKKLKFLIEKIKYVYDLDDNDSFYYKFIVRTPLLNRIIND